MYWDLVSARVADPLSSKCKLTHVTGYSLLMSNSSNSHQYHYFVDCSIYSFQSSSCSLVLTCGNIINAAPIVAGIFYAILFAWLSSASKLSTLFVAQTEMDKAEKAKKE